MMRFEFISGYIGSTIFSISILCQVHKTYKSRKADDISYLYQFTYLLATVFSLIFAYYVFYINLIIGLTVEMISVLSLIYMKYRYSPKMILPT